LEQIIENWRGYLLKEVKSSHLSLINLNDFLTLTRVEGDAVEDRADHIINKLGGFDKNKAGALSLVIRKCNTRLKVSNHEGRARAMAALKSGITEYPVAISFISCDGKRPIRTSELYFDSDVIEAQHSSEVVDVTRIKSYTPSDMLGFGSTTDISDEDLRKKIRIEFYGKATESYRMSDYIHDLNSQYQFFVSGERRKLIIGKSLIKMSDGTKRFGGMREPTLATDPNDINSYPDPNQAIKVQVVEKILPNPTETRSPK